MPAWRKLLTQSELDTLAEYVVNAAAAPGGTHCLASMHTVCHRDRVPQAPDLASALKIISGGGAHITMPVLGKVLTSEQLDALVKYALTSSNGSGIDTGGKLFSDNCSACHGQFGEGGPNPSHPTETIVPISSADFLKTRDDLTLQNIISQGQPDFGMSSFGSAYGGPLSDDQINAIVTFIRSWESNPPVALSLNTPSGPAALTGSQIFRIFAPVVMALTVRGQWTGILTLWNSRIALAMRLFKCDQQGPGSHAR